MQAKSAPQGAQRINAIEKALTTQDWGALYALLKDIDNIVLPVDLFYLWPIHPRQRDTEKHAKVWLRSRAAGRDHVITQRDVVIAVRPTETMIEDGHTRQYMWANDLLDLPPDGNVNVIVKHPTTHEEALRIYDYYDADKTTKKPSDFNFGSQREHGVYYSSPYLSAANTQALRNSWAILHGATQMIHRRSPLEWDRLGLNGTALYDFFHKPMLEIDTRVHPTKHTFNGQILCVALVTTVIDGADKALDHFFVPYMDRLNHVSVGRESNAFHRLAKERDGKMKHYRGSDEWDNICLVFRLYEEHQYRVANDMPTVYQQPTRARVPDLSRFVLREARPQKPADLRKASSAPRPAPASSSSQASQPAAPQSASNKS